MFKIGDKLTSENYMQGAAWCNKNNATIVQHGTEYVIEAIVIPEPTYAELRRAEYPSLAEQLDMLYWDSINGTTNWVNTIAEIKAKYPKPEETVEETVQVD